MVVGVIGLVYFVSRRSAKKSREAAGQRLEEAKQDINARLRYYQQMAAMNFNGDETPKGE